MAELVVDNLHLHLLRQHLHHQPHPYRHHGGGGGGGGMQCHHRSVSIPVAAVVAY